jgi:hypothetical protein
MNQSSDHGQLALEPLTWAFLERTTGFEPSTPTLARLSPHSPDQQKRRNPFAFLDFVAAV